MQTPIPLGRRCRPLLLVLALLLPPMPWTREAIAQDAPAPLTILLMGSDARPGEKIDGVRSDIMAALHVDPAAGICRMLRIPRDTRVAIPGIGETKISHALMQGGVPLARETVEGLLGIPIDYYGLIDFAGAATLIDALGGITIDNATAFAIEGKDFPAGELHLGGRDAVLFARYRGGPDGDFGRIDRQQQVFQALIEAVSQASITKLLGAARGLGGDHLRSDLTPGMLLQLGTTYRDACSAGKLMTLTLDGTVGMGWDDLFGQELSFVFVDPREIQGKVAALMGG